MVGEHSFVTTSEAEEVFAKVSSYLDLIGFELDSNVDNKITARRGKKKPKSRLIAELPQTFELNFDRGRVSVAASITPRYEKKLPIYSPWILAVLSGVEKVINGEEVVQTAQTVMDIEEVTGKIWFTSEKIYLVILFLLIGLPMLMLIAVSLFG